MHELARRCAEIAAANGFDPPTWDNFLIKAMMAITELDEGVDAVYERGEDLDPFPEELADFAIRVLGMLHAMWGDDWNNRVPRYDSKQLRWSRYRFRPVEVMLWGPLRRICKAAEAWRKDNEADTRGHLEYVVRETWMVAALLDIDLIDQIEKKCIKNEQRPHLHGKLRPEA